MLTVSPNEDLKLHYISVRTPFRVIQEFLDTYHPDLVLFDVRVDEQVYGMLGFDSLWECLELYCNRGSVW